MTANPCHMTASLCPFCAVHHALDREIGGEQCCIGCYQRIKRCHKCDGTGLLFVGEIMVDDVCPECQGVGYDPEHCPFSGYAFCERRECRDCSRRANIINAERPEGMARAWGAR